MQTIIPIELGTRANAQNNLRIATINYSNGILSVNDDMQITGIPENVWEYQIGGYQVIDKWLKEHKGKELTIDNFTHLSNIVGALSETIKLIESLEEMHNN